MKYTLYVGTKKYSLSTEGDILKVQQMEEKIRELFP